MRGAWNQVKLIALTLVAISTSAHGSFDAPHYLGSSRDRAEFKFYLHGGAFLGRTGSMQATQVVVHQQRPGQPLRTLAGCVYHFDVTNPRLDNIVCDARTPGPLQGVVYARDPKQREGSTTDAALLVCVRRCGQPVPQRLSLEEADEDNA